MNNLRLFAPKLWLILHQPNILKVLHSLTGMAEEDVPTVTESGRFEDDVSTVVLKDAFDECAAHKVAAIDMNDFVGEDLIVDECHEEPFPVRQTHDSELTTQRLQPVMECRAAGWA